MNFKLMEEFGKEKRKHQEYMDKSDEFVNLLGKKTEDFLKRSDYRGRPAKNEASSGRREKISS